MSFSSGIIITSNYIINCYPQGIDMFRSGGNVIEKNHISDNWAGIELFHSTGNVIIRNVITNNRFSGIGLLSGAERNLLIENLIVTKTYYGECIELWNANNNTLYHNNIISVYALVRISWLGGGTNFWDDGYPSGGNYWSNYTGIDFYSGPYQNETGSDGIGDTPYTIDADNVDRYPLMSPWSPLQVKVFNVTWEDTYYPVSVQSNSTVTHFIFNQTLAQIGFNVSGISGAWGFCNITIPKALMTGPWTYTFQGDVTNIDVYENDNETHTFINLQYKHASTFQVIIKASWVVPEYPSTIILTIFMLTTTVLAVLTKKRRLFMPRD
jgi:parallel beta-helix repeat protein